MNILKKITEKRIQKKIDAFNKSGMLRFFHYDFGRMRGDRDAFTLQECEEGIELLVQKINVVDCSSLEERYVLSLDVMQKLKYHLKDSKIFLLNGYNKNNSMVEGDSFVLRADFDNYKLRLEGASMLPPGFDEFNKGLYSFFEALINQ